MNKYSLFVIVSIVCVLASGCSVRGSQSELQDYIAKTKAKPARPIEPLPIFHPLPPYSYAAITERSPFQRPVQEIASVQGGKSVVPDLTRPKEFLESFTITSMSMVGTVQKGNVIWALIDTGQGGVERATVGNYMGRNHGKIISAAVTQIEIMEIVSDGDDGWVERPRVIQLEEKE